MSYQVLARKWRPAKFEQMVGQSHVLLALTNALSQQRLHHAYLFTGTRGVGKTSLARLFAKGLNCETGVTAMPCGECSSCVEISQGRFVDLIEVDAASRTKVDDTRELLDNVQYRPSRGRFKVYLIDEVHMLSRSSFNALLKTLEEPPEHVKFLLATTDPHKLPVTVLSRCLQFNLKSLTQAEISKQLDFVLTQEAIPFDPQALNLLAKAANGSMRDGLSLTDQAIAFSSGQVMLKQVQTMLGSIDEQHVIGLLKALCDADVAPLIQHVNKILAFGADAEEVLRSLLELLHQITLTQFAPAAAQSSLFSDQILAFAQQLAPEQVQLYYQMLLNGRKDMAYAPDPKSGLEMALLRAVAFVPEKQVKRWVADNPTTIDLNHVQSQPSSQFEPKEVADTSPKPLTQANEKPTQDLADTTDDVSLIADGADLALNDSLALDADPTLDDDIEDADDMVLGAEQALLLSQADSMGFESAAVTDKEESEVKAIVESNELIDSKQLFDSTDVDFTEYESIQDTSQGANQQPSISEDDQYLQFSMGEDDDDELGNDYDDYLVFSAQNSAQDLTTQHLATSDTISAEQTSFEPEIVEQPKISTPVDPEEPAIDLLDFVLANRELLQADINAHLASEETVKKESAKKPILSSTPASNKTNTTSFAATDESGIKAETLKSDVIDRPPWVAPAEGEVANQFTDQNTAVQHEAPVEYSQSMSQLQQAGGQLSQTSDQSSLAHSELAQPGINAAESKASIVDSDSNTAPDTKQAQPSNAVQDATVLDDVVLDALVAEHQITGDSVDLHWYKVMASITVGGRVRQLGVNSICQALTSPFQLLLKPDQKHLSADIAINQLQEALSAYFGEHIEVVIEFGLNPQRETPLELSKRFNQELVAQAQQSILADENIQWMMSHLAAQLDRDSVEYPPEQLGQIAQDIVASSPN